jgi:hypothetical protein
LSDSNARLGPNAYGVISRTEHLTASFMPQTTLCCFFTSTERAVVCVYGLLLGFVIGVRDLEFGIWILGCGLNAIQLCQINQIAIIIELRIRIVCI